MDELPDFAALKLLAQGNTAEIYAYSVESDISTGVCNHDTIPASGKILKLFRENFPPEPILAEYEKSKLISGELSNVPKVYDLITCRNRRGIIYEKICGSSMVRVMLRSPRKLRRNSQNLAKLHFSLHSHRINLNYSVKDKLAADIDAALALTPAEKSRIKSYLRSLPDGSALLHFDFHPGNILLRPVNPTANPSKPSIDATPIIIDWMTACVGDPCADVARTCLLLSYGELAHANPIVRRVAHPFENRIGKAYLAEYLRLSRLSRTDVEKWLLPVTAARLREWITPHEQKRLLRLIRAELAQSA